MCGEAADCTAPAGVCCRAPGGRLRARCGYALIGTGGALLGAAEGGAEGGREGEREGKREGEDSVPELPVSAGLLWPLARSEGLVAVTLVTRAGPDAASACQGVGASVAADSLGLPDGELREGNRGEGAGTAGVAVSVCLETCCFS